MLLYRGSQSYRSPSENLPIEVTRTILVMPMFIVEVGAIMVPLSFVILLFWLRLRAAGATVEEALRLTSELVLYSLFVIFGIAIVVRGWKGNDLVPLVGGTAIVVVAFIMVRFILQKSWERFPLE